MHFTHEIGPSWISVVIPVEITKIISPTVLAKYLNFHMINPHIIMWEHTKLRVLALKGPTSITVTLYIISNCETVTSRFGEGW